jgi:hypothetical protein
MRVPARVREAVEHEGGLIVLPIVVALSATFAVRTPPDLRYFELVAQIIPALFIVLAVERTVLREMRSDRRGIYRSASGFTVLVILLGEVAALYAVAASQASRITFGLTVTALFAAGLFIWWTFSNGEPHGRRGYLCASRCRPGSGRFSAAMVTQRSQARAAAHRK